MIRYEVKYKKSYYGKTPIKDQAFRAAMYANRRHKKPISVIEIDTEKKTSKTYIICSNEKMQKDTFICFDMQNLTQKILML